jgi:hypothetical protein
MRSPLAEIIVVLREAGHELTAEEIYRTGEFESKQQISILLHTWSMKHTVLLRSQEQPFRYSLNPDAKLPEHIRDEELRKALVEAHAVAPHREQPRTPAAPIPGGLSTRARIRLALMSAANGGLDRDQLWDRCAQGSSKTNFWTLLSQLKSRRKIKLLEIRDKKSIYIIGDWPEKNIRGAEQMQITQPKIPAPASTAGASESNGRGYVPQRETAPIKTLPESEENGDAEYAINARGELGIEKDGEKIILTAQEFAVLRQFIDRTKAVWGGHGQ